MYTLLALIITSLCHITHIIPSRFLSFSLTSTVTPCRTSPRVSAAASSSTSAMAETDTDMVAEVAVEAVIGVTTIVATMPARIKFYLGIRKPTAMNAET